LTNLTREILYMSLAGKTIFITGASRGIGHAIALRAAQDGANIVIAAKTAEPHAVLPGTIHSAAADFEEAGGRALAIQCDIRDEAQLSRAVDEAVAHFGGLDVLVNNASAISLTGTAETDVKRFDLMHAVNARGTWLASKLCAPHLLNADAGGRILNIAPPLAMSEKWFRGHTAYTMAKYGMSMCVLGECGGFLRRVFF
jgi:citronellol/citronellal dehydrogenase